LRGLSSRKLKRPAGEQLAYGAHVGGDDAVAVPGVAFAVLEDAAAVVAMQAWA
jgi:hypothetical protein